MIQWMRKMLMPHGSAKARQSVGYPQQLPTENNEIYHLLLQVVDVEVLLKSLI